MVFRVYKLSVTIFSRFVAPVEIACLGFEFLGPSGGTDAYLTLSFGAMIILIT